VVVCGCLGRIEAQPVEVVAIGIAAANRQHAGAQDIRNRVRDVRGIAMVGKGHHSCAESKLGMKLELRQALLTAIATRESKHERRVRLAAPLAFVSPGVVTAIIDATVPAHLTVTGLADKLPYSWAERERHVGLVRYSEQSRPFGLPAGGGGWQMP
jgi:hypothetical protein